MTLRLSTALGAALLALAAPAVATAQPATAVFDNATVFATQSLDNASTTGAAMAGMRVTAYFADGSESTDTWRDLGIQGDLGEDLFGASTGLFRLTYAADASTGAPDLFGWALTNGSTTALTRLVLSGAGGLTVFDAVENFDDDLTPNSANGYVLRFGADMFGGDSPYAAGSVVTYANPVAVGGSAPFFDIYERLHVAFGTALGAGETLYFSQDTDNAVPGSLIEPNAPATTTPEPATVTLLAAGLAGVVGVARRRRRVT